MAPLSYHSIVKINIISVVATIDSVVVSPTYQSYAFGCLPPNSPPLTSGLLIGILASATLCLVQANDLSVMAV